VERETTAFTEERHKWEQSFAEEAQGHARDLAERDSTSAELRGLRERLEHMEKDHAQELQTAERRLVEERESLRRQYDRELEKVKREHAQKVENLSGQLRTTQLQVRWLLVSLGITRLERL